MQKRKFMLVGILFIISSISLSCSVAAVFVPPGGGNPSTKYGFFFWTSEIGTQLIIDGYEQVLRNKGYTTYDYKNSDIYSVFNDIDTIEDCNDKLFFYFLGHGRFSNGKSYVRYTPTKEISSLMMQLEFAAFEAPDVSILVDACKAGDFVNRFMSHNGYLVMTSTDETHNSYFWELTKDPWFSSAFWGTLAGFPGLTAKDAFYNARMVYWYFYPQIVDNSDYTFF